LTNRDPEKNFEALWKTFHRRYPFFELRNVDWHKQYEVYRPRISSTTSDKELFEVFCSMLDPLDDGHVEITARLGHSKAKVHFTAEKAPRFYREFTTPQIKRLFDVTRATLAANGFSPFRKSKAWIMRYCRSPDYGYMRILELEDVKKKKVSKALDILSRDMPDLKGFIIDIRDNPGGEDSIALMIINRFTDRMRVAFHRRSKIGPGTDEFGPLKTWHISPKGGVQFTRPIVLLTCDAVFSGAECFALALRELPYATILGEDTNGIFSYQLEKTLPNGWDYSLSYQEYLSADMICYEGKGVPADIELLNTKADLDAGEDPLITRALEILSQQNNRVSI
jgi:carboxyl-terminal processing protease